MNLKYFVYLLLPALFAAKLSQGQNLPDLTATFPSGLVTPIAIPPSLNSGATPNYVRTYVPKLPVTDATALDDNTAPDVVQKTTEYKDGFTRSIQTVLHNYTSGSTPNLIQPSDVRFQPEDHSFLPYPSASDAYDPNMFSNQYNFTFNNFVGEQYTAYGISRNISNASQRAQKSLQPGRTQVGQNRGAVLQQTTNAAGEVKIWQLDGSGLPISNGTYAAGMLFGKQAYDTSGSLTTIYTDREGHIVCDIVKLNTTINGSAITVNNGITYYVYDIMGRLIYTIPPKASDLSGSSVSTSVLNNLCFQYKYDNKGRLFAKRFPGETGFTELVYDLKGRSVMARSPQDASLNQWNISFFDVQGRMKATSLFSNSDNRDTWQSLMDAGSPSSSSSDLTYYLLSGAGESTYPSETAISGNQMMSYSYYDDYTISDPGDIKWTDLNNKLEFNQTLTSTGAETPQRYMHSVGMLTGSRTRIISSPNADLSKIGSWREFIPYYDQKGREVFSVRYDLDNNGNIIHANYIGSQYDYTDRMILTKHAIRNANESNGITHTELTNDVYDANTGRITKTNRRTDNGAWVIQSMYSYNALGQMSRKVLGNYGEVQDNSYNIRGQLQGINEIYATTGDRQGESRTFGEALRYDYGFSQPQYAGKIAGMIWRGAGTSALANAYGYSYDNSGRLTSADYRRYENPSWSKASADYTVSNLTYDLNGNIMSMDQRGVKPGVGVVDIDKLVYNYDNSEQSNNLLRVMDNATFQDLGDFNNTNGSSNDYTYDQNGNLLTDANKNLSVTYTYFNKPQVITLSNNQSIEYSYDAGGNKVEELELNSGTPTKRTDYVGNYIYENDQLQFALTGEGRSVFNKDNNTFTEEYFVKDHLGNVRSVVDVSTPTIATYLGTYEIASSALESLMFDNLDDIRDDRPGGSFGNTMAVNLDGMDPDKRVGSSMMLKVMAGDHLELNVNSYYENYDPGQDQPVDPSDMLNSIVHTLQGGVGGFVGSESHDTKSVDAAFTRDNYTNFNNIINDNTDADKPKAYLNYIVFDENMSLIPDASRVFQANGNGQWSTIGTSEPMEIPVNGYVAIYLSNATQNIACEPCGSVYFDQLLIRFTHGQLKEETHYYPHGLPIVSMGGKGSNLVQNRHKYQGNEYITDLGLNWMDFDARQYDPQIGRFLSVDPHADAAWQQVYSPYAAMGNQPESAVDPNGKQAFIDATLGSTGMIQSMAILGDLFGGNFHYGKNGEIVFDDRNAAEQAFSNFCQSGSGGGSAATFAAMVNLGNQILAATKEGSTYNIIVGLAGNSLDYSIVAGSLEETKILGEAKIGALHRFANWIKNWDVWKPGSTYGSNRKERSDQGGTEFLTKNPLGEGNAGVVTKNGNIDPKSINIDDIIDAVNLNSPKPEAPNTLLKEWLEPYQKAAEDADQVSEGMEKLKEATKEDNKVIIYIQGSPFSYSVSASGGTPEEQNAGINHTMDSLHNVENSKP